MFSVQPSNVYRDENIVQDGLATPWKSENTKSSRKVLGVRKILGVSNENGERKGQYKSDRGDGALKGSTDRLLTGKKSRRPLANITNSVATSKGESAGVLKQQPLKPSGVQTKSRFIARVPAQCYLDASDEMECLAGRCGYDLEQESAAKENNQIQARVQALAACFGSLDQPGNESDCSRDVEPCLTEEPSELITESYTPERMAEGPALDMYFTCFSDAFSEEEL